MRTLSLVGPSSTALLAGALLVVVSACGNSSSGGGTGGAAGGTTGAGASTTAAAVKGPADMHCGTMTQVTSMGVCNLVAGPDAGAGGSTGPTYGPTMYGSSGNDDDCKYKVSWTATPVAENQDVTFDVVAHTTVDGKPAQGANLILEVFLNDTHPAPNTNQTAKETSPGTYAVGPVRFDAPGKWTVRFHFYEMCTDLSPESPHGHAAFFVQVP